MGSVPGNRRHGNARPIFLPDSAPPVGSTVAPRAARKRIFGVPLLARPARKRDGAPHRPSASAAPLLLVAALMVGALAFFLWRGTSLQHPGLSALSLGNLAAEATSSPDPVRTFRVPKLPAGAIARAWVEEEGRAVLVRPDRSQLKLTLVPGVQRAIEVKLRKLALPYAAVVLIEPATGAIIAWVERREPKKAAGRGLGLTRASAPAASVIKVVTASALLEARVHPDHQTCFHGGLRGLNKSHLKPSARDSQCESLTTSLARSSNAAFGRLAIERLKAGDLQAKAEDFWFQTPLNFDIEVQPSTFKEGRGKLARARGAAGFRGARISPLHAAMLAATVANDGVMMRPFLVAEDTLQPGLRRNPSRLNETLSPRTAGTLRQMLAHTISDGTGTKAFAKWPESLAETEVGGKTGTLAETRGGTYRLFTWFVGMAPVDKPEIAVAALAVNGRAWRAKGVSLARDALAIWLQHRNGAIEADPTAKKGTPSGPAATPSPDP